MTSDDLGPVPDRLTGVHPTLVMAVRKILIAMKFIGRPMMVTDGVRTLQKQQALYAQGRTAPGKIVTNADGILIRSNHQAKGDGWGYAVDLAFLRDGKPSWAEDHPWKLYGEMAKALGLRWGGDWKALNDRPHIELPHA
jgi:peptidoglycan L-alanyl-D-glutamate endopeptidase CwlK